MEVKKPDVTLLEEQFVKPSPWFQPPRIRPNLGNVHKKHSLIPKSKVDHVLLHENKNEKNILDAEIAYLDNEHCRQARSSELQRRAFLVRQSSKQAHLWGSGIDHVKLLPEQVVEMHLPGAKRNSMQSSQRRHSIARKSAHSKRGLSSAGGLTSSGYGLTRSQSFHTTLSVRTRARTRFEDGEDDINCNEKLSERDEICEHVGATTSGRLPRKPVTVVNGTSAADTSSPECVSLGRRGASELPLNLTRSFTTYNTKLRREVTIANPQQMNIRASEDPRFINLKTALIPPLRPIDSVLQISPSGRDVMQRYGNSLYDYNEFKKLLEDLNKQFPARDKPVEKAKMATPMNALRRRLITRRFCGYLPNNEAFVDDASLYSSPSLSELSSMVFSEAE